ncbi:FG-GAP repeat domain-containing protein [Olivibacter domesticus]|nr:VCBS repeat-containing protein [Olivibacter domesticus]
MEFRTNLKNLRVIIILALFTLTNYSCLDAQESETAYFKDVTVSHVPADPEAHALDVALLDVDGDSDLDVILALESQPNRLYLNDGNGKLEWKKKVFVNENHDTEHVRIADFNRDNLMDVIFVAEDDQHHEYYLGKGDGSFENVSERLLTRSEGNGLDVGDVNGDGLPDIVIGNSGENGQNFLWINDSKQPGFFVDLTAKALPQVNDATQSVKLADLDGDGDLDMVVGNEIPPNRLLINDGQGVFTESQLDLPEPLHTREVLVFDADMDGDLDIAFANLTSNGGKWEKNPHTRLLINNGHTKFEDKTQNKMPAKKVSTYAAIPIDFDSDGDQDLLLSTIMIPPFEGRQVYAYKNDGKGNFSDITAEVIPKITHGRSWGIAVGDLNNDGIKDVVIGGWGSQVRLLLGKNAP